MIKVIALLLVLSFCVIAIYWSTGGWRKKDD